jgi:hypothetical protein
MESLHSSWSDARLSKTVNILHNVNIDVDKIGELDQETQQQVGSALLSPIYFGVFEHGHNTRLCKCGQESKATVNVLLTRGLGRPVVVK